jgi:RNA polymerase sigma-70 factor (ECF subfamily)
MGLQNTAARFEPTHWSLVLRAGDVRAGDAAAALEQLCRAYWPPLYAYVRRRGLDPDDAQDMIQGFFADFLQRPWSQRLTPHEGRFRTFLLAALDHFLANDWDRRHTQKRGGGAVPVSLDLVAAENFYGQEPAHSAPPVHVFDRAWATALVGGVFEQFRLTCEHAGKGALFAELCQSILQGEDWPDAPAAAARLGWSEDAVRQARRRLRQRFRELLEAAVQAIASCWRSLVFARANCQPAGSMAGEVHDSSDEVRSPRTGAAFGATRWSLVLAARAQSSAEADAALARLCELYWYPVYAFLRRQRGRSPQDAEDLTQGFFTHVLRREWLKNVGPEKGRFRTFVLRCLTNFVLNQPRPAPTVSIDFTDAEQRYAVEPVDHVTPERLFELRWAASLLERAASALRAEAEAAGKGPRFEILLPYVSRETAPGALAEAAARLGLSEEATRQEVSRLRKRYREALRGEIAETLASPQEVDDELRHLLGILSG